MSVRHSPGGNFARQRSNWRATATKVNNNYQTAKEVFDGLKINCIGTNFRDWEDHPDLEFKGVTNLRTGELLPEARRAEYNGLIFKIAPSTVQPGQYRCYVQGSLHRFANGGAANDGDFTFSQVRAALDDLQNRFGIDPNRARLENIEFGLNIKMPYQVRKFLQSLICHYFQNYRQFSDLDTKDPYLGKVAHRQQYSVKIYDKGKQAATGADNILRLEIHVSKMIFLSGYNVATLADLTDQAKVSSLAGLLQKLFSGVMLYESSAQAGSMSEKERANLNDWKNPLYWLNLDKDARYKNRQKFADFLEKQGANMAFLNVVKTVPTLWKNLLYETQKTGDQLTNSETPRTYDFSDQLTVKIKGESVALDNNVIYTHKRVKNPQNLPPPGPSGMAVHKRKNFHIFCGCCGRDISGQKVGSRFCSEKLFGPGARRCRDAVHRQRLKAANQNEAETLQGFLPDLFALAVSITVFVKDTAPGELRPVATVIPAQVAGLRFTPLRPAVRVDVLTTTGAALTFTRSRAKSLLKFIARAARSAETAPNRKAQKQQIKKIKHQNFQTCDT